MRVICEIGHGFIGIDTSVFTDVKVFIPEKERWFPINHFAVASYYKIIPHTRENSNLSKYELEAPEGTALQFTSVKTRYGKIVKRKMYLLEMAEFNNLSLDGIENIGFIRGNFTILQVIADDDGKGARKVKPGINGRKIIMEEGNERIEKGKVQNKRGISY